MRKSTMLLILLPAMLFSAQELRNPAAAQAPQPARLPAPAA